MTPIHKPVRYTHRTKGGVYEIVVDASNKSIKSAGGLRRQGVVIVLYRDVETFQMYVREKADFDSTMVVI